ncbi:FtsX-like permease family protein [Actinocrispum wychmicini]|uniref:Putative ABC transport system permease protein n=1 Tax=Actinocrispum wychmicini TaxID=1213861 RepID=A0A4R2J921_9PSEU|nr:FtsX-like permease family protein [Actinocrispum wychmicini]TCO55811.1 putative ABC transport system permease protein [Actinocrispum wychmicini]
MWRLALRTLRFRVGGFVATFVAVFLGAGIIVACGGLMETGIRTAVPPQRLAAAAVVVTGQQSYQVPNKDPLDKKDIKSVPLAERDRVDTSLVDAVRRVPGVSAAFGDVSFPATVLSGDRPVDVGSQGHDWASAPLTPYTLRDGNAPARPGEVVLDAGLAHRVAVAVGGRVGIVAGGDTHEYRVSGIAVTSAGVDGGAVFFGTADVEALAGHPGKLDAIGVLAGPGTTPGTLRDRITAMLGDRPVVALTGDDRGVAEFPVAVGGSEQLIVLAAVFAGMAIFVAMFVVASALGLSVQHRQRELALLRAVGATPRQLRRMVLVEAVAVALLGAALGCVLGVFLGPYLYDRIASAGVIPPVVVFHQGFIAYLAGPGAAVLSAVVAAWITGGRAAATRPTEALAEAAVRRRWVSRPRVLLAVLFLLMGVGLFFVTMLVMRGQMASATAGPASMCWAIALALLAPGLTKVVIAVLRRPLRAIHGLAGELATINAATRAVRTAGAVTPIMLAVAIAVANLYTQTTQSEAAQRNYADSLRADIVLSAPLGGFASGTRDAVRQVPGVAGASDYVTSMGWIDSPYDSSHRESPWPLVGITADDARNTITAEPARGSLADLRGATVALPVEQAQDIGRTVGDTVTLRLGDRGTVDVRVVALLPARAGYETLLLPAELLAAHTTSGLPPQILVHAAPGADRDALKAAIAQRLRDHTGVQIADGSAFTTKFAEGTNTQALVNYLLVALVIGYTLIAVANTLVTATARRRQEFGLQRLIGSTRGQILRMLGVEAGLIAVTGIVLGTIASAVTLVPFSIVVNRTPFPSGPLWMYGIVVVGAVALAMAATLIPASRSMRSRPVEAAKAPE